VGWSLAWIFGSSTPYQDWTAMAFFALDLIGVVLTSLTDSLMYGQRSALSSLFRGMAIVLVPLVIAANVVAGFVYHMTSPASQRRRAERRAQAEYQKKMDEVQKMALDLEYAERYLLARQEQLEKSQLLAEIKAQQDALEAQVQARLARRVTEQASGRGLSELQKRIEALTAVPAAAGGSNGGSEEAAFFRP